MTRLSNKLKFEGTGVALITPFKEDLSIDVQALRDLVNYCIDGGVDYLVALGTTAEVVTLSSSEKGLIREVIVEENKGRLPLMVGIGGNNTVQLVEELKRDELHGFDAVLSVSPYYNKPTQEGIYRHFMALAEVSQKPLLVYNVPSRTGSNMSAETVIRLAHSHPNIIGVKEASGDMEQVETLIGNAPKGFMVISGDDLTALPTVLKGGSGVISVLGQGIPTIFSKMIALGLEGEKEEAENLNSSLVFMIDLIFREGNPAGIKSVLELKGIGSSIVRLPLVEATKTLKVDIQKALTSLDKTYSLLSSTE